MVQFSVPIWLCVHNGGSVALYVRGVCVLLTAAVNVQRAVTKRVNMCATLCFI